MWGSTSENLKRSVWARDGTCLCATARYLLRTQPPGSAEMEIAEVQETRGSLKMNFTATPSWKHVWHVTSGHNAHLEKDLVQGCLIFGYPCSDGIQSDP